MKTEKIVFAHEVKKDCEILKDILSLDQAKADAIYSSTIENEEKSIPFIKKIITSIMTIVVALLSGLSLLFIFFINKIVNSDWASFIFFFSLIVYVVPAFIFNYQKKPVIASSLAVFGLILMSVSQSLGIFLENTPVIFLFLLSCLVMTLLYLFFTSRGIKILLFLFFFNSVFSFIMKYILNGGEISINLSIICYISMIISILFYSTAFFLKKNLTPGNKKKYIIPLEYNSVFYFYLYFFILTFIKIEDTSLPYYIHNILFFIFTTGTVILFFKRDTNIKKQIALIFFSAFIFYKYYDLVWLLLHKSLVLIILGILITGTATIFAVQWGVFKKHAQ